MKTYKKPEIELSSFDTDIIATSGEGLTVETANDGAYVATQGTIKFATDNKVTIDPFTK